MTFNQAKKEVKALFGEDSFVEKDERRFYVGKCPLKSGMYVGFMGFSWLEAVNLARTDCGLEERKES